MRREVAAGMIKAYMHLQQKYLSEGFQNALRTAISALEQPEIIRCKDCKECEIDEVFHDYWCKGRKVWESHYCGYDKRRTDERLDQ